MRCLDECRESKCVGCYAADEGRSEGPPIHMPRILLNAKADTRLQSISLKLQVNTYAHVNNIMNKEGHCSGVLFIPQLMNMLPIEFKKKFVPTRRHAAVLHHVHIIYHSPEFISQLARCPYCPGSLPNQVSPIQHSVPAHHLHLHLNPAWPLKSKSPS